MPRTALRAHSSRYQGVTDTKAEGATYTPQALADFVAEAIVKSARLQAKASIRILDPAVGDGELLMSLLARLRLGTKARLKVRGFETDPTALDRTLGRLTVAFPQIETHLECVNFLDYAITQGASESRSPLFRFQPERFDLIIANPPYVRTQVMGAHRAQTLAAAFGLSGRVDLYHAFLTAMARLLEPSGTAGIIVSNRFMTTKGGRHVRAVLRHQLSLRHIWDLGDTKLFDAAVLPAVILADGRERQDAVAEPAFTSIYQTKATAALEANDPLAAISLVGNVALTDGRVFHVQHGRLDSSEAPDDVWRIATDGGDKWLGIVADHTWKTFRDIGKVRVGVKTCADKIFIRSDWDDLPGLARPELLRPVTTHHVGRRFRATSEATQRWILYPHECHDGQRRAVELGSHSASRAYLEAHRSSLESRTYVLKAGRRWYEIWVPQDPEQWAAPKLVFRDIAEKPTFWIDREGTVVNGDCYWLGCDSLAREELLWLAAAVANSTFGEAFYDRRFNNKLYAGRRRFITQYVEKFPLPDPKTALARAIIDAANNIYRCAGTAEALELELQLDRMVWQVFGLAARG